MSVDITPKVKERLMSLSEIENKEELSQELGLLTDQVAEEEKSDRHKIIMGWVASGVMHACIFVMVTMIAFTMAKDESIDLPPMRISSIPLPVKPIIKDDTNKVRDLVEKQVLLESDKETDNTKEAPFNPLDIPENVISSSEDDNNTAVPLGREEALASTEMGGQGLMNFMGVGGNSSGMFGNRIGGGKLRAKNKMGPFGNTSDTASDAGLRWLKRHQSATGAWSATKYFENCLVGVKCEPGKGSAGDADAAMTGYSVLCFLGMGFDHKMSSRYRDVVKKGITYLISIQKPDGLLGERNYEHAVATMALVEAYAMSCDPEVRKSAQLAVDCLVSRQAMEKEGDPYSGLLWDYAAPNASRCDLSVNGWVLMSLKSAIGAGLNTKNAMDGAKKSIVRTWKASNPDWEKKTDPYKDVTIFPYTWNALTNATDKDHLSFVGATCAVFMGHRSGDIMLETLMNDAMNRWVTNEKYKTNSYSVYYILLSAFQMGGERWKTVLNTIVPHLLATQRRSEDCLDGSWDYTGQQWPGSDTSRVLSTTFSILSLEVAYRYAVVNNVKLPKNNK